MIRIKTRSGEIIQKQEDEIIDKIKDSGEQFSIALIGKSVYLVIERDFDGAIFGEPESPAATLGRKGGASESDAKRKASARRERITAKGENNENLSKI